MAFFYDILLFFGDEWQYLQTNETEHYFFLVIMKKYSNFASCLLVI